MFSQPYSSSKGWSFIHCDGAAGSTYCTWVTKIEGRLEMRVDNASHKVVDVQRISLGSVEAGRVFHAWRIGSSSAAAPYTTDEALYTLFSHAYSAADHWLPDGCEGAAGSLYCTWHNDAGKTLVLQVDHMSSPNQVVAVSGTYSG
jgi:hypothetical protein